MPRSLRRLCAITLVAASAVMAAPAASASTFTFPGRGWGHGVGMSQWGARGLADDGMTSTQILTHYYSGTAVETKTLPGEIRVGLVQEKTDLTIFGDGTFDLYDRTGAKRASPAADEKWRIHSNGNTLEVYKPNVTNPVFTSGAPVTARYESAGTTVGLSQTGYEYKHGRIDFDINDETGKARAILIVGFEKYLYGLGEMPSSWNTEALKAQAIAGRTYAFEKIGRLGQNRTVCNCAVYASTADQAYVGVEHEVTRWVAAVDATASKVVTYGGKPIQALYSASTGGFTENNENVFGGTALPYLRGVCDPGDYYDGVNPNANWLVTMDSSELQSELDDAGYHVGTVKSVTYPSPRGVSGRVLSVKDATHGGVLIDGSLSDAHISGSTFRSILGLKSNLIFFRIYGGIRQRYDDLNCKPGLPKNEESSWKSLAGTTVGRAQDFKYGRLFFRNDTAKVYLTLGGILAKYDERRKAGQDLGLPLSDETGVTGGRLSPFDNGNIYWSSDTKAHEVHGAILAKYLGSGGPAKWGLPTTDELSAPGGRSSRFVKARIYWTPEHGAHVVYGAILKAYLDLGGGSGKLGLPISDEYGVTGGRRSDFQHGYITWNSSTGKTSYKIT